MNLAIAEKYPVRTLTQVDGRMCTHYDMFLEWIKTLKNGFIAQKEYEGYPILPKCWLDGMIMYDDAPESEKKMMASALMTELTEALRHWKVDRDVLYGADYWTKFWEG